jgi:hemin uptake protein HemP
VAAQKVVPDYSLFVMQNNPRSSAERPSPSPVAAPRRFSSRELFGRGDLIEIEHNGEIYTLRLTRRDKLILTK